MKNSKENIFSYKVHTDGTATITGFLPDKERPSALIIPENIDGYKVTRIEGYAFGRTDIEKLVLPSTIIELGQSVFADCTKLKEVQINAPLTTIPAAAFTACRSLEKINIPSTVKTIESVAFFECTALSNIELSDNIENIYINAFSMTGLNHNEKLRDGPSLYLNNHLITCENCRGEYKVREGTIHLATGAFYSNIQLSKITLPETLKYIESSAFGFTNISSLLIPANVEKMSPNAFALAGNLSELVVDKNNKFYSSDFQGVLYDKNKTEIICVPLKRQYDCFVIPKTVSKIDTEVISSIIKQSNKIVFNKKNILSPDIMEEFRRCAKENNVDIEVSKSFDIEL